MPSATGNSDKYLSRFTRQSRYGKWKHDKYCSEGRVLTPAAKLGCRWRQVILFSVQFVAAVRNIDEDN